MRTYPGALSQAVKTKLVRDLGGVHCVLRSALALSRNLFLRDNMTYGQILLVGEDQQDSITEFIFVQHALQLLPSLDDTVSIVAVDNEDDTLGVLEVMAPQRADLVLSTDIPHRELNVLVLDRLNVESWWLTERVSCAHMI